MDDILAKKNRHLFLEEKDNQNNSFIGNINDVANRKEELDTVAAHIANVDTVGDHINNVDTVANNISDINDAVDNIATVKTFNDNVNNGTMQYLLEAFTTSLNEQGNAWEVRLTQLGESILATTSAFNYSTVVTVSSDIPANGTLILPNSMKYKVGTHMLMVSWNGTVCYVGEQYDEVGAYGVWATSIKLNQPAKAGDKIQLRIVALTDQSSYVDITEAAINASQFTASGSNTERYLPEFLGDVVNVKNFGAVGNGINDDTTAFQSAIASGKAVFIPEGTYKLNTDLNGVFCGVGNSTFTGGTVNGSTILRGIAQRNSDIVNVKDFGAKGDGETNDTEAIQVALDAGAGKTVFIPAGVYLISATLIAHAGTKIIGAGKCDYWKSAYSTTGTVLKTTGVGNPSQWTDITGEDTNETPLLVCGGNGIYVDDLTLYTDESTNTWSIGLFYPAVKQCGFHRIGAYGFSNAPIYLDCTWGSNVTALTSLHPSVVTGDGMNEFYGEDFFARAKKITISNKGETEIGNTECYGVKVKGTTRNPDSYNNSTWLWSAGGASDIVFNKGRTTGILVDGAMNTGNGAIQGIRFNNVDIRMRSGCDYGYGIYLNRCNRISFRGGYSEVSNTHDGRGYANFSTTNTYLVSFEDIEYGFYVSLNDTATSYRLDRGVPSVYDGSLYKPSVRVTTKSGSVVSNEIKTPYPNFSIRTIDIATENNEYTISRNDLIRFDVSNSSAKSIEVGDNITLLLNASARPKETSTHNLGSSSYKWATIYVDSVGKANNRVENGYFNNISANSGSISDSDKNLKSNITDVDNNLLRAWGNIEIKLFRFNDAVEKKGEKARIHAGIIAQDVEKAFSSEGIDASRYGLFCYDSWDDVYEDELIVDKEESIDDETGVTIPAKTHIEKRLVSKGGSRYGIRYEEALVLECAYLRNELKKQNAKIEALMQRISALENNR